MAKCRKKPVVIEANLWFQNGDHPEDDREVIYDNLTGLPFFGEGKIVRYYRRPDVSGDVTCSSCAKPMHDHGWIDTPLDGSTVCPGDVIIADQQGAYFVLTRDEFAATYEGVED